MSQDELCINTIRALSADVVQGANSGHPGAPMGCAPMAHVLFSEVMKFSAGNLSWPNRDRFVLSNGHCCALQYVMLHLCGYDLSMDDLKNFRQLESKTPGHPESHMTGGIEVSTGPLGQGISNAVGFAAARAHFAAIYNKPGFELFNHGTFVICGDGCLQEGISSEACSLAGHLGLGSLTVLYDDNDITIDGGTNLSFTEDVLARFEAYGWHTSRVLDGDSDVADMKAKIAAARAVTDKPSIIAVKTIIGKGSAKEGTHSVHGAPLGDADIKFVKSKFGLDPEAKYNVGDDVRGVYGAAVAKGDAACAAWTELFAGYKAAFPTEAAEIERRFMGGGLPSGWKDLLPTLTAADKPNATRNLSQSVLKALCPVCPELMGGSADLTPSNKTWVDGMGDFQKETPSGRYFRFGVREHAMAAMCNGMSAYGGIVPYCATFLNFIEYGYGAVRLSALSQHQVIYVMTHDSIGLGEDGPTHQPVEALLLCRSTPGMMTWRPADQNETSGAYCAALESHGPSVLSLARQKSKQLAGSSIENALKGAYTLSTPATAPVLVIVGTGTEVDLCVDAAAALNASGVATQVVSMPCWEAFDAQSLEYKMSVFPSGAAVLSVEAGSTQGWPKYSHAQVGMTTFGASGPGPAVMAHFGFTVENVVAKGKTLAEYYAAREGGAEPLMGKPF